MADADVDGAHIRTLLLTLFFKTMRPLIDAGRIYAAVPPLHRVEVVNPGSKANDYIYTYSDAELPRVLADLDKRGRSYKSPPQRYKGLGEMDAEQLAETTMDPRRRTLRRITVGDAENAEAVFELLMGNDVAPRRDFIVDGAVRPGPRPHRRLTYSAEPPLLWPGKTWESGSMIGAALLTARAASPKPTEMSGTLPG